jgi:Protein of unknown function (DUF1014).
LYACIVAEKADEQARKRAEKAALLAAEEASMSGKPVKKLPKGGSSSSSSKKKKNNDLSLLEDALVSDADKKVKAAKRAARLKREQEERERMEKERQRQEDAKNMDPLLANTDAMIGDSINAVLEMEGGGGGGGGRLNAPLVAGDIDASGIDAALSSMKLATSGGAGVDDHPEKRMKALHKAFEEKMMPEMKQQYPGLKRSQYLEKIFILWKKSPENPMNWPSSKKESK